uniref:RNase H type-1 domain-containing protein n=1 Tax=Cannabis sativa TaxID=3483 RepID=A0A803NTS6_CANSA
MEILSNCILRFKEFYVVYGDPSSENSCSNVLLTNSLTIVVDCWTFQVDASVGNSEASIGMTQKGCADLGDAVMAVNFISVCCVLEGELRAINLALQVAKSKGISKLIESDSIVAVKGFSFGSLLFGWDSFPLFLDCINRFKEFEFVEIVVYFLFYY